MSPYIKAALEHTGRDSHGDEHTVAHNRLLFEIAKGIREGGRLTHPLYIGYLSIMYPLLSIMYPLLSLMYPIFTHYLCIIYPLRIRYSSIMYLLFIQYVSAIYPVCIH